MWTGRPPCEECASLLSTWIRPGRGDRSASRPPSARAGRSRPSPGSARPRSTRRRDALEHVGREVALGVGDQGAVAALGELLDAAQQAVAERAGRRLEQDPVPAAERDPGQLLLVEPLDRGLRHLAPRQDLDRDPLVAQAPVDGVDPVRDLLRSARRGRGGCAGSRRSPRSRRPPPGAPCRRCRGCRGRRRRPRGGCGSADRSPGRPTTALQPGVQTLVQAAREHGATMTGMIQHLLSLGLRGRMGFNSMNKKTTRRGNYESGSDYVLEYGELRFAFNEEDFGQRVEQAAVKLGFVAAGAQPARSSTTCSTSPSTARSPSPARDSASTSTRTGRTSSAPPTAASSTGSAASSSAAPGSTSGSRRASSTSSSTSAPRPSATSSRTAAQS